MKKLFPLLVFLLLSSTLFAQKKGTAKKTEAEYTRVFSQFVKFYNDTQPDSLQSLFTNNKYNHWTPSDLIKTQQEMGKIVSFKYMGSLFNDLDIEANPVVYFKVNYDKPAQLNSHYGFDGGVNGKRDHAVMFALSENNQISTEAFMARSKEIDSLLARY